MKIFNIVTDDDAVVDGWIACLDDDEYFLYEDGVQVGTFRSKDSLLSFVKQVLLDSDPELKNQNERTLERKQRLKDRLKERSEERLQKRLKVVEDAPNA